MMTHKFKSNFTKTTEYQPLIEDFEEWENGNVLDATQSSKKENDKK